MPRVETQTGICASCGALIDTSLFGDELTCMACLLRLGFAQRKRDASGDSLGLSAPARIGPYVIARRDDGRPWVLGRGAMGITFRATDESLQRPVALKIINTDLKSRSIEGRERFTREARAAGALRHPNVATVYQFGVSEETGQFFYAMELVEGETLEERVRRLGPLNVLATIDVALQVTAALAAAEERGLVHRDLKPGNLMLVGSGKQGAVTVKVIDFGVAKAIGEKTNAMSLTHGGFVGTPAYASPEQFTNVPVDVRSDIYSLGATLWFALTGHMLFSGRTVEEILEARGSQQLPIEQLKAARVPHRFITLLRSMLAIEPAARPAGARELAARLQRIRDPITGRGKIARRLATAAAFVGFAVVIAVRVFHPTPLKTTEPVIPEKSIAVLPFENLGGDPNNAYFAEGIQEEILTRLASIAGLKVISRTSTQPYQSRPRNLREIAKQLGVANILEGSVQKATDQIRVNVQLVNAQTDSHLWADTYDRKLTDIFGVESEIANGIAESLQAKLTGREQQALALRPTNNLEAYDAYLRGLAFQGRHDVSFSFDLLWKAVGCYERAVQLDPNFALAWARLSRADSDLYFNRVDTATAARGDLAKRALENAQKLQPNSPETLLALGYYQYWVLLDYVLAKSTFARVSKILPSNSEAPKALGLISRRDGHWDESIAYFEQALALDPRNMDLLTAAAWTYTMLRQFPPALKLDDRALDITPNDLDVRASKARIYQAQGNLQQAAGLLSEINGQKFFEQIFATKIAQLRLERNYSEDIRLLRARLAQFPSASEIERAYFQLHLAFMQRLAGDTAGAKLTAEQARATYEQRHRDQPDKGGWLLGLSLAYAAIGEKDSALNLAERAVAFLPRAKDAMDGPGCEANLALIQTLFGENSRAISTLTGLLQTPYSYFLQQSPITPALLRLDPFWDPLRSDPAFQKLCEENQN